MSCGCGFAAGVIGGMNLFALAVAFGGLANHFVLEESGQLLVKTTFRLLISTSDSDTCWRH